MSKVFKTATVSTLESTPDELEKVNVFALEKQNADDLYLFKVAVCSNAQNTDRDNEPLMLSALEDLAQRLRGKTVIFDHAPTAKNQVARIYDTSLEKSGELTEAGEELTRLVVRCYMVKTASNADLIAEIRAGIKKEVSVGFATSKITCSVCGSDAGRCTHRPGETYSGKVCRRQIRNCIDAYEVSFVAVPCQTDAGTVKSFDSGDADAEKELEARIKIKEIIFKEEKAK
jgi:hypothetical protein